MSNEPEADDSSNQDTEQTDPTQWVALRIGLAAPPVSVQTVPLRATYTSRTGSDPLDLVRLDDIAPEIFNLFSGQVQAVLVYVEDGHENPHKPTNELKFQIALGANRPEPGPGTLDTGTKQKTALVATPLPPFVVLDLPALIDALTPP